MENINWKEKAGLLLTDNIDEETYFQAVDSELSYAMYTTLQDRMIEFAKLACEEQKKICMQEAKLFEHCIDPEDPKGENEEEPEYWNEQGVAIDVDWDTIRNAPTVKFD